MSEEKKEVNQNTYDEVTICTKCKTALFGSGNMLCGSCEKEDSIEVIEGFVYSAELDELSFADVDTSVVNGHLTDILLSKYLGKNVRVSIEVI